MRINVADRTFTGTKISRVSVRVPGLMSANRGKPLCTYFERTGQCRYGDRCRYQHATSHNSAAAFSERSWSRSQVSSHHMECAHTSASQQYCTRSQDWVIRCQWGALQASPNLKPDGSQTIRIMSYNILADLLVCLYAGRTCSF